jgi:hypothetical protein
MSSLTVHRRGRRRTRRAPLPGILRRHHPQQEHADGLPLCGQSVLAWCEHHKLGQLADIEPLHVAAYIEALGKDFEKPTVK